MSKLNSRHGRILPFNFKPVHTSLEAMHERLSEIIRSADIFDAGKDSEAVNEAISNIRWAQIYVHHAMKAMRLWQRTRRKPQDDLKS